MKLSERRESHGENTAAIATRRESHGENTAARVQW